MKQVCVYVFVLHVHNSKYFSLYNPKINYPMQHSGEKGQ